jgi:hypothetical protein
VQSAKPERGGWWSRETEINWSGTLTEGNRWKAAAARRVEKNGSETTRTAGVSE